MSYQERNTILKIKSTGEYLTQDEKGIHLTMHRNQARPFTEDEITAEQKKWNQKLVRAGVWIIPLWKNKKSKHRYEQHL